MWRVTSDIASRTDEIFKFRLVSVSEVQRILKSLKCSKSVGADNLPSRLLEHPASAIALPLTYIINLSLKSGLVPTEWKSAKIVPIHKAGSRSNMDNYRPISVLPTISKVLERVVHRQLMNYDMVMLILCYTSATYDLTSYLLTIYKRIRKQQNVPLTMALPKCRGVNPGGFGGV